MEQKIVDKIKELKKGDTVVVYSDYDKRVSPFEEFVKSIGKKQITTGINCHNSKKLNRKGSKNSFIVQNFTTFSTKGMRGGSRWR